MLGAAAIRSPRPADPDESFRTGLPLWLRLVALGAAAVALVAYQLHGFAAFWPCAVVVLLVGAWLFAPHPRPPPVGPSDPDERSPRRDGWLLVALCVVGAAVTLFIHRPDIDDGFYVSVAADALRRPAAAVWGGDSLMGDPRLPVMLSIYKLESHELVVAGIAQLTGTTALRAAHTLLPPVMAVFAVLAWALLAADLDRRRWAWVAAVAVAVALLAGESHRAPGNFAFVRLHQGKAVLASVMIPLLYHYGWRWATTHDWRDAALLAAANIAALGTSSTAVVLAPMVTVTAIATGAITAKRRGMFQTRWVAGATLVYPLMAGLLVHRSMIGVEWLAEWPIEAPGEVMANFLGPHQALALLAAVLCAWVVARDRLAAIRLLAPVALLLFVLLNPLLANLLTDLVFSPSAYWRVTWVVPWIVWVAAAVVGVVERFGRWPVAVGALALSTLGWYPVWRAANGVLLGWGLLNVDPVAFATAERIAAATPAERLALAPTVVASWTAALPQRPPLVAVRAHYTASYHPALPADEIAARNELGAIVDKAVISEQDAATLLAGVRRFDIGTLAFDADAAPPTLTAALRLADFTPEASGPYVVWHLREHR